MMFDDKEMNKSLSEKIGVNKDVLKKKKTGGTKGAAGSKKKKTKSPWDSDSASGKILILLTVNAYYKNMKKNRYTIVLS